MSTKRETLLSEEDVMFPKDFGPALSPLDVREIYEAARAKDAAAIAHMDHCRAMLGAAEDETLADAIQRVRAKDAELIQRLVDAGNAMRRWIEYAAPAYCDEQDLHNAGRATEQWAAAAGFTPTNS